MTSTSAAPAVVDVAVVGGGAAGLAAALFTARRDPSLRVVVLDGARKLGAKILVSGGGRCNVTNTVVTASDFNGGSRRAIDRVLRAFDAQRTREFFASIGVFLCEEAGGSGKLFPQTNSARTVLDALLAEAARLGVRIETSSRVSRLRAAEDGTFTLVIQPGRDLRARRVVMATGGLSLPKTGSDGAGYDMVKALGHTLVAPTPALVPLVLEGSFHVPLAGVAHPAEVRVLVGGRTVARARGPLLWTHFGVSGPAVLDVSRHWHRARLSSGAVSVEAGLVPGHDFGSLDRLLVDSAVERGGTGLARVLSQLLPERLTVAVLEGLAMDPSARLAHLPRDDRRRLIRALLAWPLPAASSRGFNQAEVTAGGVPLDEVDPATMESRVRPGLHLCGEILDVDGRIGGFNFQWAWSSAFVSARGLAGRAQRC